MADSFDKLGEKKKKVNPRKLQKQLLKHTSSEPGGRRS